MTWQDHYDRACHLAARARTTTGAAQREYAAQAVNALRDALDVARAGRSAPRGSRREHPPRARGAATNRGRRVTRLALPPSLLAINPHLRGSARRAPRVVATPVVTREGNAVVAVLDGLRLDVTPNSRGHWATKARRIAHQRAVIDAALARVTPPRGLRYVVTVTRRSPGRRMDLDNLYGSVKGSIDATCAWLGIDDGDARVTIRAAQERAPWGVVLRVESVTSDGVGT